LDAGLVGLPLERGSGERSVFGILPETLDRQVFVPKTQGVIVPIIDVVVVAGT
jgi:hypothetical protein